MLICFIEVCPSWSCCRRAIFLVGLAQDTILIASSDNGRCNA
jgi:hypothetical protein